MISSLRNGKRRPRYRFVHLSDLHLQADTRGLSVADIGLHRAIPRLELEHLGRGAKFDAARDRLARVAEEVDALAPDMVLITGDLTALALEAEFHFAHDVIASLSTPGRRVVVVPGNHDRYAPGGPESRLFEEHLGHLARTDLPAYADYLFGRLGDDQLARLRALLDDRALAGRAVVAMVHHAPLDAEGRRNPFSGGLIDGARLLELLAGRCAVLVCGHVHRRFRLKADATRPEIVCAGSVTERGSEGYWVLDVEEKRVFAAEEILPDVPDTGVGRRVA